MAAAPDNGFLRPPGPPPLGAILVQRGLLTQEQLNAALAENKRTGEPTGEVIVRLGFASAATIAQALATQHGGPLKTEYGYAVGFGGASPTGPVSPPPVSPVPAQDERPVASAPASAVRAARSAEPAPVPALPAPAASPLPAAAPPAPAPVAQQADPVTQWQQYAQQLAAQRDAALREIEATKSRLAELDAAFASRSGELATAAARLAELETARTNESDHALELAAAREEAASFRTEKEVLERARAEAEARNAELERELAELRASAAADDGHLAAATARLAELESAVARDAEIEADLARAREDAARVRAERAVLEAAHESTASHAAGLEDRLKTLEAAAARAEQLERRLEEAVAQIAHLETEREDVLKVAKVLGEERRHHDHAEDPAHLLFVPGREGYRLVEQDGPPPAPGATLELEDDEGTAIELTVMKVGASPLPGTRLACAYLVAAA